MSLTARARRLACTGERSDAGFDAFVQGLEVGGVSVGGDRRVRPFEEGCSQLVVGAVSSDRLFCVVDLALFVRRNDKLRSLGFVLHGLSPAASACSLYGHAGVVCPLRRKSGADRPDGTKPEGSARGRTTRPAIASSSHNPRCRAFAGPPWWARAEPGAGAALGPGQWMLRRVAAFWWATRAWSAGERRAALQGRSGWRNRGRWRRLRAASRSRDALSGRGGLSGRSHLRGVFDIMLLAGGAKPLNGEHRRWQPVGLLLLGFDPLGVAGDQ